MKIVEKSSQSSAKRLWRILRAVCYVLKEGISRHVLTMDLKLHLLLERGKVAAGKSISSNLEGLSCRYVDPAKSYYDPQEVEFSCSSTPLHPPKRRSGSRLHGRYGCGDHEAAVARAFEILGAAGDGYDPTVAAESPMGAWRRPAVVRQVRVTDSPFPLVEEGKEEESGVDEEAEEFIRRFYLQLRLQNKASQ